MVVQWNINSCIQCGCCAIVCPHACIRPYLLNGADSAKAPESFETKPAVGRAFTGLQYRLQVSPKDCTGCEVCTKVCPVNIGGRMVALEMKPLKSQSEEEANWEYAQTLPEYKGDLNLKTVKDSQFKKPLFEYTGACSGCGATPYIKLVSQLFGDRLIVADEDNLSSVRGGFAPVCPYNIAGNSYDNEDINIQGEGIAARKHSPIKDLLDEYIFPPDKSVWLFCDDIWGYETGIDKLGYISSQKKNINILMVDTEARLSFGNQITESRKHATLLDMVADKISIMNNMGLRAISYGDIYVAQVSMAEPPQVIKAMLEADAYNGPSLIIAYAPCIEHGVAMSQMVEMNMRAVNSGYWYTYRFNPTSENKFAIDCRTPKTPYSEFVSDERWYLELSDQYPDKAAEIVAKNQRIAEDPVNYYQRLIIELQENKHKDYESILDRLADFSLYVNEKEIGDVETVEEDCISPNQTAISDGEYDGYIIENGEIRGNNINLTRIDIPDGVTGIEDNAFMGYKSLEEVTIPESVTYIGTSAFDGCSKLKSIIIPKGVDEINMLAFNECTNLIEVVLPEDIICIGLYAFNECTKLTKINLPDSISTISSKAFRGCMSLTNITLPSGINVISGSTFEGCKNLETISIPESVTEIEASAFEECEKLTMIHIPKDVHTIGICAFEGCAKLEHIIIPAGVTEISYKAFWGCKKLKTITIPKGVITIGEDAFNGCESLTEIEIPEGVETIEDDAFNACRSLKDISIPSTVNTVGIRAFYQCASLTEVKIPNGIKEIPYRAFYECTELKSAYLPDTVTSICEFAFYGCTALREIVLPLSLEQIGDYAFNGCESLGKIEIPDSVTTIGDFAFDDCDALKSVSMPGQEVETGCWAFPDESVISYRSGNGRLSKRKPGISSYLLTRDSDDSSETVQQSSERYTSVMPSDELYSHYGKLKREADKFKRMGARLVQNNGEEFQALDMIRILESNKKTRTNVYHKLSEAVKEDNYTLDEMALKFSQIFRVNESVFDRRHDVEGDIHETLLDKKWKLSALRSFAWTLADLADREGKSIDDYEYDELVRLCDFIKDREWLNYQAGSWFDGLCGHPDIHVFYMPGKMIESGEADEICDVLKNDPITSLDSFRDDLSLLKNAMIRLYNGILENRDRDVKLDTPSSAVLQAWCVMAMAAKIPFISEDGPMFFYHSYRKDALNTTPIPVGKQKASVKKSAPREVIEEASSIMSSAANYEIIRGSDGKERVKLGEYPMGSPITWLVLEKNCKDLLLLSEYGLDAKPFNSFLESGVFTNEWHDCSLRSWLNDGFYTVAFSTDERAMVVEGTYDTYKKTANGEEATTPVRDKVSLLNAKEARKYFKKERDLICKATSFAKEQGAEIEDGPNQCSWWLRSPAVEMMGMKQWTASVRADGSCKGWGSIAGDVCVRPVIRVLANKFHAGRQSASEKKPTSVKRSTSKTDLTTPKPVSVIRETTSDAGTLSYAQESNGNIDGYVIVDNSLTKYEGRSKNIVVPDGVTRIDNSAFSGINSIETITLPSDLRTIGNNAFFHCERLKNINLPEGLIDIGFDAFAHCDSLISIDIPNTVRNICGGAFSYCKNLKRVRISGTLTNIGSNAFFSCDSIENVVIYGGICSFRVLTKFKKHFLDGVNVSWEEEGKSAVPESGHQPENSVAILKTMTHKEADAQQKGENPKENSRQLERYLYNDEIEFKDRQFAFSSRDIYPPYTLIKRTYLGGGQWCRDVTEKTDYLVIESLDFIEDGKLEKAIELIDNGINIRIVLLDDYEKALNTKGYTEDALRAFLKKREAEYRRKQEEEDCKICETILLDLGGASVIEKEQISDMELPARAKVIIPEGVVSIKKDAFRLSAIREVVLPASLRSMDDYAFSECFKLENVDLKEGIEKIGCGAFYRCPKLRQLHLPNSLTTVNQNIIVFSLDDDPEKTTNAVLYLSGNLARYLHHNKPSKYRPAIYGKTFIIDGKRYGDIESYVESYQKEQQKYVEAEEHEMNVIRRQEEELKEDYVLDLHDETVIKENQFAFDRIKALGKVIIPEGVVEIEEMAFCWNSTMTEVVFPSTLRKIGSMAFQKCSALRKIQLNDGLEEIGISAFTECYNLLEIHLPDSLRTVDIHAFDSWDLTSRDFVSVATLYLSGKLAWYLQEHTQYPALTPVNAKEVVVDGKQFLSIKDYIENYKKELQIHREAEEYERQEQLRRDVEERARQERVKQERERQQKEERERQAALERKKAERQRINAEIFELSNEINNLKGLLAGMKRKNIQKRIDELNEQLRKL